MHPLAIILLSDASPPLPLVACNSYIRQTLAVVQCSLVILGGEGHSNNGFDYNVGSLTKIKGNR